MIRALLILLLTTVLTIGSAYAQDVEQLAKADPLSVSGGLTASGIYINHLQGRSLALSNDVGKSLRRTREASQEQINILNTFIATCTELLDQKYVISPIMSTDAHIIFEIIKK